MTEAKPKPKTSKIAKAAIWICAGSFVCLPLTLLFVTIAASAQEKKLITIATATSIIGRSFGLLFFAGLLISFFAGIIGFFHALFTRQKGIVLSIAASVLPILFLAFAMHNLLRFGARAKQSEARTELLAIYKAQESFRQKNGKYAKTFTQLGWKPTSKYQRYAYFLSSNEFLEPDLYQSLALPKGAFAFIMDKHFQIVAVGNLDSDTTPDVWAIDEKGQLTNLVNDIDK